MANETDKERINYLEKRVEELQKKLAAAESPGIFLKVLVTLILAGTCFIVWKCRTFFKWAILALIGWWIFGGTITSVFTNTGNFISTTWTEWKASGKVEDEHERAMERMRVEAETANSRTKAEADAQVSTTRAAADAENSRTQAVADADTARVKAEADARTRVIQAEEAAKQAEWERGQAERRNNAVNDAIRGGHWHSDTPMTQPEVTAPAAPEIAKPAASVEVQPSPAEKVNPETETSAAPNVTVKSTGRTPKIERTVNGNTTRVVVRF